MTTTPEPAVSPAPDTEALRQRAAAILYRHRPLPRDVDALDDEAADFYAELVSRAVYAPVLAGLRSDLDQARTERDILDKALQDARKIAATYRHLLETRRGAGARTIPDDAAERLARWLFRMNGRRQGEPLYGDGAASPERQEKRWTTWLEDEDRERLREMARHVLADLGATPTTDPAPAAADGEVPIDVVRRIKADALLEARDAARAARRLCWAENREQEVIRHYGGMAGWLATRAKAIEAGEEPDWPDAAYVTPPAVPQAPAQPTEAFRHHDLVFNPVTRVSARDTATGHSGALLNVEDFGPAAREDTAPPNPTRCAGCNAADEFWCSCPDGYTPTGEYGENVIVPNLARPSAPPVDGDTPVRPEEA